MRDVMRNNIVLLQRPGECDMMEQEVQKSVMLTGKSSRSRGLLRVHKIIEQLGDNQSSPWWRSHCKREGGITDGLVFATLDFSLNAPHPVSR